MTALITGCASCKARKIKCDELRPQCSACARFDTPCHYEYIPLRSQPNSPRPILPAPKHHGAVGPSLCIVPKSVFGSLAPRDVGYLEFFVRGLQGQFSLSRVGDSTVSDFCKHLSEPSFSSPHLVHPSLVYALCFKLLSCLYKGPSDLETYLFPCYQHYRVPYRSTAGNTRGIHARRPSGHCSSC